MPGVSQLNKKGVLCGCLIALYYYTYQVHVKVNLITIPWHMSIDLIHAIAEEREGATEEQSVTKVFFCYRSAMLSIWHNSISMQQPTSHLSHINTTVVAFSYAYMIVLCVVFVCLYVESL